MLMNIVIPLFGTPMQMGWDWINYFHPAVLESLAGRNALVTVPNYFSPPWAIALLLPFLWMPDSIAPIVLFLVSLISFYVVAIKLGASPLAAILVVLSPPILISSFVGNVDWIVALGMIAPVWLAPILLLVKPQAGFAVVIYLFLRVLFTDGIYKTIKLFLPMTVVFAASLLLYGPWPLQMMTATGALWNFSPFPWLVPAGIALLYKAIREQKQSYSILASPFLSPFLHSVSFGVPVLGLVRSWPLTLAATVGLWMAFIFLLHL